MPIAIGGGVEAVSGSGQPRDHRAVSAVVAGCNSPVAATLPRSPMTARLVCCASFCSVDNFPYGTKRPSKSPLLTRRVSAERLYPSRRQTGKTNAGAGPWARTMRPSSLYCHRSRGRSGG